MIEDHWPDDPLGEVPMRTNIVWVSPDSARGAFIIVTADSNIYQRSESNSVTFTTAREALIHMLAQRLNGYTMPPGDAAWLRRRIEDGTTNQEE